MPKKPKEQKEPQDLLGIERIYTRYKNWCLNVPTSKARVYGIGGLCISIALILASILVPFIPEVLLPFLTWPVGIFVFLAGLYIAINFADQREDHVTIKERFSFKQRIRIVVISSILAVIILLYCSQFLPSSIGGTLLIAYILTAFNVVRRTPGEIELANLGLADERDINDGELINDDPKAQYFEEDFIEEDNTDTRNGRSTL